MRVACPHYERCDGCSVATHVHEPPVLERARRFFSTEANVEQLPSVMASATGWRTHAKLAVRGTSADPMLGLFRRGTHEVEPIPECAVHHRSINAAAAELLALLRETRTSIYDEGSQSGLLRYVQLNVERSSSTVQLVLVCNAPPEPPDRRPPAAMTSLLAALRERAAHDGSVWHSVWVHYNDERRNNILSYKPAPPGSTRWHCVLGEPAVRERVLHREFEYSPWVFRQANLDGFERIVERVAARVGEDARVCELYAGIGLIGLNCLERARSVRCSDVNPLLDEPVAAALAALPAELRARATYTRRDAGESAEEFKARPDELIVDPPRKGLDRAVLELLHRTPSVRALHYVSCGYLALERDARELLNAGWVVRDAEAHVLFPGADHIETLVFFERRT